MDLIFLDSNRVGYEFNFFGSESGRMDLGQPDRTRLIMFFEVIL
jgi:hypothetical protein